MLASKIPGAEGCFSPLTSMVFISLKALTWKINSPATCWTRSLPRAKIRISSSVFCKPINSIGVSGLEGISGSGISIAGMLLAGSSSIANVGYNNSASIGGSGAVGATGISISVSGNFNKEKVKSRGSTCLA